MESLHSNGERICGVCVNQQSIYASNVVLATGGFFGLFTNSTNPKGNIGQGIALAHKAGALLGDLEFVQFHPTRICHPNFPPLLSEALRGEVRFSKQNHDRFYGTVSSNG